MTAVVFFFDSMCLGKFLFPLGVMFIEPMTLILKLWWMMIIWGHLVSYSCYYKFGIWVVLREVMVLVYECTSSLAVHFRAGPDQSGHALCALCNIIV
jgi:hypothetical protein